mmetsp:Transcript_17648/g.39869  ORF Transcript_17648/g.39869 Transcript_17648/m.39869 type:complete len:256 (-) Transcript_17648:443-1210(-)
MLLTATRMSWPHNLNSSPGMKCSGALGKPKSSNPLLMPCAVLPTIADTAASQLRMLGRSFGSPLASPVPPFTLPSRLVVSVPPTLPAPPSTALAPMSRPKARKALEISTERASDLEWLCWSASQSIASTATLWCEDRRAAAASRPIAGLPPFRCPALFWSSYARESSLLSRPRKVWPLTTSVQSSLSARRAVSAVATHSWGSVSTAFSVGSASGAAARGRQSCNTLRSSAWSASSGPEPSVFEKSGGSSKARLNG